MLRSLYTAISGLNAHQEMLDVTANNIANVNTNGYKASAAVFEDALSQTLSAGGQNADQIGLGVRVAGTNLNFAQGSPKATGVPSNLMIDGNGFFMTSKSGIQTFTRDGTFTLDQSGHLSTVDGAQVMGADGKVLTLTGLVDGTYKTYSIGGDGTITGVKQDGTLASLGQVGIATFGNPNGLSKIGDNQYLQTPTSGAPQTGAANTGSRGSLMSGYVEMSNVDLSQELTNLIVAERGFQANSKVITTSDEVLQTLVNLKN